MCFFECFADFVLIFVTKNVSITKGVDEYENDLC